MVSVGEYHKRILIIAIVMGVTKLLDSRQNQSEIIVLELTRTSLVVAKYCLSLVHISIRHCCHNSHLKFGVTVRFKMKSVFFIVFFVIAAMISVVDNTVCQDENRHEIKCEFSGIKRP